MWKWVLYSLVLFNVAFFAWNSHRGVLLKQTSQNDGLDGIVKLLLLKEQPQEEVNEAPSDIRGKMCFSVGPLSRKAEVRAVQKRLSTWDIDARRRVQKTSIDGFWVIIPPAKSRKEASRKIKILKELGIRDYFLVATGSQKNAISLGVFSRSSSARRRLKEMKNKSIDAKIIGADLPKRSYWLDWPATSHALTVEQLGILQKTFQGIGKVAINCQV